MASDAKTNSISAILSQKLDKYDQTCLLISKQLAISTSGASVRSKKKIQFFASKYQ